LTAAGLAEMPAEVRVVDAPLTVFLNEIRKYPLETVCDTFHVIEVREPLVRVQLFGVTIVGLAVV